MTDYSSSRHKASDSGEKSYYGLGNLTLSGSGTIPGTEDEGDGEPACEVIVRVSSDVIGRVIGKEGSNINRIRKVGRLVGRLVCRYGREDPLLT